MHTILMDQSRLSQVFLGFEPLEALKVKRNIDAVFTELSLPSESLLAEMARQGIQLPDQNQDSNKLDITTINETVLNNHLTALFLDKSKLLGAVTSLSLKEKIELRAFFKTLMPLLHLPSNDLVAQMQSEGLLDELFGEQDKAASVKQRLASLNVEKATQVDDVKKRLAALSNNTPVTDELTIARVKANLSKVTTDSSEVDLKKMKDKIAQLG